MQTQAKAFAIITLCCLVFFLAALLPATATAKGLRVTVLLEHQAKSTWSYLLSKGLAKAKRDFGIQSRIVVASDPEKQTAVFRECAQSADLVVVASDRFHEILRDNAGAFRSVRFGVIDASIMGSNIHCITFADEQASYLAGMAAALFADATTQDTGKGKAIGWISGQDIPAMQSLFAGYREGAKLAIPDIRVIQGVVGSFADPKRGAEEAKRLINEGVSVLAMAAGGSNAGVLAQAKEAGIFVIGVDTDHKDSYPGHVLLSIIKNVDEAIYTIIKDCVHNTFAGKTITVYDLKHGVSLTDPKLSLKQNAKHYAPILSTINRRIEEVTKEIEQGSIRIRSLRQRTLCNCL